MIYYFTLIPLILFVNYFIFKLIKDKNTFIDLLVYGFFFFIIIRFIAKVYDLFDLPENMPKTINIYIFLMFSWFICISKLGKKYINQRVDIYEQLNLRRYIGDVTFLEVFTILLTVYQLYLIFSKTIFQLE